MELYFLEGKWVGFRGGLLDCNHTFFSILKHKILYMINDVQMVELNVLNVLAKGGHEICFSHSKCSKKERKVVKFERNFF